MQLTDIDNEIYNCNLCNEMIEKFPNSKTVSVGTRSDIVILGRLPRIMVGEKVELHGMM